MIVVTPPAAAERGCARHAFAGRAAGVHVRVDVPGQDQLPGGDVDALLGRSARPAPASAAMRPSAMPISPSRAALPGARSGR